MTKIILSSNNSPNYLPYWSIVSKAWRKVCGLEPVLAYVDHSDSKVEELSKFGQVYHYKPNPNLPIGNQSKVARHYLASQFGDEVCMLQDVDMLPLSNIHIEDHLRHKKPNHILCVGHEVYQGTADEGKFPMTYFTAEGKLFKEIMNPHSLPFDKYVGTFIGIKEIDNKEDISIKTPVGVDGCFSDESLLRVMIKRWGKDRIIHKPRGWHPYTKGAICRANWDSWDLKSLQNGKYKECHLPRPYNPNKIKPLLDYLGLSI